MISDRDNAYISWILDESVVSKYKSFIPLELVEATVEEIYDKFYKNEVARDVYDKLLAIDPTGTNTKKGKYLDWLIRKARFPQAQYPIRAHLHSRQRLYNRERLVVSCFDFGSWT